jgi:hypothetical protein
MTQVGAARAFRFVICVRWSEVARTSVVVRRYRREERCPDAVDDARAAVATILAESVARLGNGPARHRRDQQSVGRRLLIPSLKYCQVVDAIIVITNDANVPTPLPRAR